MTLGPQFKNYARKIRVTDNHIFSPMSNIETHEPDDSSSSPYIEQRNTGNLIRTMYEYVPDDSTLEGTEAIAMVKHRGTSSTNRYPVDYEHNEQWAKATAGTENTVDDAGDRIGQIPLFVHSSELGSSTLDYLSSTKPSRIHALNLVGIAAVDTEKRYKRTVVPDTNLSPYSRRLVDSLDAAGVTTAPPIQAGNNMKFLKSPMETIGKRQNTMQPKTVGEGVKRVRDIARIRRTQKAAQKHQGEQLSLNI